MLRHGRGQEYVYTLPRGDNTQNFVFLRIISFAFAIFEMLKTAFCAREHIINIMKKYISMTKLQRKYYPSCEQCFII